MTPAIIVPCPSGGILAEGRGVVPSAPVPAAGRLVQNDRGPLLDIGHAGIGDREIVFAGNGLIAKEVVAGDESALQAGVVRDSRVDDGDGHSSARSHPLRPAELGDPHERLRQIRAPHRIAEVLVVAPAAEEFLRLVRGEPSPDGRLEIVAPRALELGEWNGRDRLGGLDVRVGPEIRKHVLRFDVVLAFDDVSSPRGIQFPDDVKALPVGTVLNVASRGPEANEKLLAR